MPEISLLRVSFLLHYIPQEESSSGSGEACGHCLTQPGGGGGFRGLKGPHLLGVRVCPLPQHTYTHCARVSTNPSASAQLASPSYSCEGDLVAAQAILGSSEVQIPGTPGVHSLGSLPAGEPHGVLGCGHAPAQLGRRVSARQLQLCAEWKGLRGLA